MRKYLSIGLLFLIVIALASCDFSSNQADAHDSAVDKARDRNYYIPTHDVEYNNYERRAKLADNPASIIWCTSAFPIPGSPLFTIPVVGKLTSSGKRPFPNDPGPDGMYGDSVPYRYGFTPEGNYVEWQDSMSVFCTSQPTVWQRETTTITLATDTSLSQAEARAQALLAKGDTAGAQKVLEEAISSGK